MTHEERAKLLARLRHDARRIADHFGLDYQAIHAEHPNVKSRYGLCTSDGVIKIRLNHAKTHRPLKYSGLVDTLCHELAHLRHFNHGPEFKQFFWELLGWARQQGIYRPASRRDGARRAAAPEQEPRFRPLMRNGVAVFHPPEPSRANDPPPWEKWQLEPAQGRSSAAPGRERQPKPPAPARPAILDGQLELF